MWPVKRKKLKWLTSGILPQNPSWVNLGVVLEFANPVHMFKVSNQLLGHKLLNVSKQKLTTYLMKDSNKKDRVKVKEGSRETIWKKQRTT